MLTKRGATVGMRFKNSKISIQRRIDCELTTKLRIDKFCKILNPRGFDIEDGCLFSQKKIARGSKNKMLAEFVAWPVKEVILDDGISVKRYFDMKGILPDGRSLSTIRVADNEFMGMNWVMKSWGIKALVASSGKAELREAIQILGKNIKTERQYTHTGWRKIDNQWVFLHAGGAIGNRNVTVDLSEGGYSLQRYSISRDDVDLSKAVGATFSLLEIGPSEIIYPLLAATFLSPLCELMQQVSVSPDFTLFLVGRTQSGKSSLAALFLSFFGNFDKMNFPANYKQTANSLEKISFILKDVLLVIDDYYPAQSKSGQEAMRKLAQSLARGYGDGAGRTRMNSGMKIKASYFPRGLAISTGEERPDIGESGQARFVFIDVKRDEIDYENGLVAIENNRQYLAQFMTMYIEWVAENWDRIKLEILENYNKARREHFNNEGLGRLNDSMSKLWLGIEMFLLFVSEKDLASNPEDIDRTAYTAYHAFKSLLDNNAKELLIEKPTDRFLNALTELINTGELEIVSAKEKAKSTKCIVCYDKSNVYLRPTDSYEAVKNFYKRRGEDFAITYNNLTKQLIDEGVISYNESRKRNTWQKKLPCMGKDKPIDVFVVSRDKFSEVEILKNPELNILKSRQAK